jgi:tetratricopeptide (TPR) repeat protein
MGDLHMRAGDFHDAVDSLLSAERMRPDVRSELLLAISYQRLKQPSQATKYLEMAEHRAPNNPEVERSMAGYYRETGNYVKAIAELKAIPSPKPDVIAELAYTYQLDGKLDESAQLYVRAANAVPKDMGLQLSAAQAEIALGSLEKANPFLARASEIDPNYYRLHAILGSVDKNLEHDQDALKEYQTALANMPADPAEGPLYAIQLHMNLMDVDKDLDDAASARHELETAQTEINALGNVQDNRGGFLRLRALIKMNVGDLNGALGDMKEALALNAHDRDDLQLNGDILMKMGQTEAAIKSYKQILDADPRNRGALTSLGYASRVAGRDQEAEKYFARLEQADPTNYVPYLALGDLYTGRRDFSKAQASYDKAYALAPKRGAIEAGGMNAAIEDHNLNIAGTWLSRVTPAMEHDPQILREKERYLSFKGDDAESAAVGEEALKVLPKDRDVVVYLGYDLLHLEKWDELLALTTKYLDAFPKEPDLPLLEGYVHKHQGDS